MLNATILVGNPKPQSRTLKLAEALVNQLLIAGSYNLRVIDLTEHSSHLFEWPSPEMVELTQAVADSDLLVVASPTYKATYTGLLKSFLDRYAAHGLRGVAAIPVMTGADLSHSMAPDVHLRPLLIELGATVPTKGFYFVTGQMGKMEEIVAAWADENLAALRLMQPVALGILAKSPRPVSISASAGAHA
jgi:FMN reductase